MLVPPPVASNDAGVPTTLARVVLTYFLSFDSEYNAKHFVMRLHLELQDVATYRDGTEVTVLDASPFGQRERIMQLSRSSSATMVKVKDPA